MDCNVSDGSPILFTNWASGEPNKPDEECLMMFSDGKWNDAGCDITKQAFCQQGNMLSCIVILNDLFIAFMYDHVSYTYLY